MFSSKGTFFFGVLYQQSLAFFFAWKWQLEITGVNFFKSHKTRKHLFSSFKSNWLFAIQNDFRTIEFQVVCNFGFINLKRGISRGFLFFSIKSDFLLILISIVKEFLDSFFDGEIFLFFSSSEELFGHFHLYIKQGEIILLQGWRQVLLFNWGRYLPRFVFKTHCN